MGNKFRERFVLFIIFSLALTVFLLAMHSPGHQQNISSSDEFDKLEQELIRLEQILIEEKSQLDRLKSDMEVETRAKVHPRARILKQPPVGGPPQIWTEPIPVLVFVCNRVDAVREHLQKLIRYRPAAGFPIVVSQDCDNRELQDMIKQEFGTMVHYIKHISSETARLRPPKEHRNFATYYKIARHYKLGLTHVFERLNHTSVIVTEDDLDVAPDFFEYFLATRPLLERDQSLFCVSAWNDNGKPELIDTGATSLLYRTDFFPGLGWMMTRSFWEEIKPRWPDAFWDDFVREPEQRRNRACIRPEISRTGMTEFGKSGASKGLFFTRHLKRIVLNRSPVQFSSAAANMTALLKQHYDEAFLARVYALPQTTVDRLLGIGGEQQKEWRIEYASMDQFVEIAQRLGIMADTKAGVPRTAYLGVVVCFSNTKRIFIAPSSGAAWKGYDRHWEAPRNVLDGLS